MSSDFYSQLPVREQFVEIADPQHYTPVPHDWFVLSSDVDGSTDAILAGRYKEVNTIGASTIVALLNVARAVAPPIEVPFLFGGDGATVLVPPELIGPSRGALLAAQDVARNVFRLRLRIGSIPVADIRQQGHEVAVARFRISPYYDQAMFVGGGIAFADRVLKDPLRPDRYAIAETDARAEADFQGLECRWRDVPSHYGETVTLIVMATTGAAESDRTVYREVVQFLESTFEGSDQPISAGWMHLSTRPSDIRSMAGFAVRGGKSKRMLFQMKTVFENLYFGWAKFRHKAVRGVQPETLIRETIAATDHRKFDDMLRMVVSSSPERRRDVTDYLNSRSEAGDLVYGMHLSDRALLTCVVFEQAGAQVHFVDGADGGYAMAARELKSKLDGTAAAARSV